MNPFRFLIAIIGVAILITLSPANAKADESNKKTIVTFSRANAGYMVDLEGFTDNIGTEKYNLGLSDRRVESVLRYLVDQDVPLYRLSLVGLGTEEPVADNRAVEGREQNRRVEVRVLRSLNTTENASR